MPANSVPHPDDREAKLLRDWDAKLTAARKVHVDYDKAVSSVDVDGPGVLAMYEALLEDKNGAEVLYYLATHPRELERIAALSPVGAIKEVAALSVAIDPANFDPQYVNLIAKSEAFLKRGKEMLQNLEKRPLTPEPRSSPIDELLADLKRRQDIFDRRDKIRFARQEREAAESHALQTEILRRRLNLPPAKNTAGLESPTPVNAQSPPHEAAADRQDPAPGEGQIGTPKSIAERKAERKKLRDDYKAECKEKGVRMGSKKIAKAAHPTWNTRDPIQKWLALDPRYEGEPDRLIRKVFKEKPHIHKT